MSMRGQFFVASGTMRQGAKQDNPVIYLVPNRNAGRLKNSCDTMTLVGVCLSPAHPFQGGAFANKNSAEKTCLNVLGANGRMRAVTWRQYSESRAQMNDHETIRLLGQSQAEPRTRV
jgi:hypothetical protein